ncbi:MAG: uL22 family ribosomal protein, partial [Patescibacteria group bacterium]
DGGPVMKRGMPRAFGRSYPIRRKTSHVTLVLDVKK